MAKRAQRATPGEALAGLSDSPREPEADGGECPHCGGYGYVVGEDNVARPCACGLEDGRRLAARLRQSGIPTRFLTKTIDSFKVERGDDTRRRLVHALRAYSASFEREHVGGLLLRGKPGSGKTHLAVGVLREVMKRGFSGYFVGFSALLKEITNTFREGSAESESQLLEPVVSSDLVVIDDVGAERLSEWVSAQLYHIINQRYESSRALVITTNFDEAELQARFGERTMSRLHEMCEGGAIRFPDEDFRRLR